VPPQALSALLEDARNLEPLPQSASRLASLLAGSSWKASEVAECLRLDQALTGRLLSVANSARAGAREPIASVDAALMRLGAGAVLGIAMGAAVKSNYQYALPIYGLEEGELWRHSVASALAIEELARVTRRSVPPEAFSCALLHDVGKLVLARHLTPELCQLAGTGTGFDGSGTMTCDVERAVLAIDHAKLGGSIARTWGLPNTIALGIEHHEEPLQARPDAGRLVALLVSVADAAAVRAGAPCGGLEQDPDFALFHAEGLRLSREQFDEIGSSVARRLEDVLRRYQ
jgi:putative nucleotidyltransferase with HDIG domain